MAALVIAEHDHKTVYPATLAAVTAAKKLGDVTVLVAPLKTVDTVVSRIPILSGVLGGVDAEIRIARRNHKKQIHRRVE